MVIVDSSVWIDLLWGTKNRHTVWLDAALGRREIGLTSLILCEVLQGTRSQAHFKRCRKRLLSLPVFEAISIEIAVASAQNFRKLRDLGITVRSTTDCMIATFCILEGYPLLHRDRDFNAFQAHLGLNVINPPIPFPN
jgi:predicted nucleic acid-binding protein